MLINESIASDGALEVVLKALEEFKNLNDFTHVCQRILDLIESIQVAQEMDSGNLKAGGTYNIDDDEEFNKVYDLLMDAWHKFGCDK